MKWAQFEAIQSSITPSFIKHDTLLTAVLIYWQENKYYVLNIFVHLNLWLLIIFSVIDLHMSKKGIINSWVLFTCVCVCVYVGIF